MLRLSKAGLLTAFVCLLVLAPAVRADDQPFTGTGTIPGFNTSGSHYTFDTFGTADPIGDFTGSGEFDLDSTTGLITNGDIIYVDANGDTLEVTYSGSIDATGAFSVTFTVVGGTGPWDGATGGGTNTGQLAADGSATYSIDGTITLP